MGCCGSNTSSREARYQSRQSYTQPTPQRQSEPPKPQVEQRQQLVMVSIQIQRPEPIYEQGVGLLKQERYADAFEKFIQVKKMSPQFPNIEESILICIVCMKIQEIYQEGQQLFKRGDFEEAIKRFEYIENRLQNDYKDVPRYIDACRQGIWKQKLQMVLIHIQVTEAIEEMQRMQSFFNLMAFLHQQEQRKMPNPPQKRIDQKDNKQPNYNETNLDYVRIYSDCFKEPQCALRSNSRPYKHQKCGSIAYFHANGQVSCEANCQQYQIKEACFFCSNSTIRKIEFQMDKFRGEMIQDEQWLAKFVELCLLKGNYTEGQAWNFREKIPYGAYLQFLQK